MFSIIVHSSGLHYDSWSTSPKWYHWDFELQVLISVNSFLICYLFPSLNILILNSAMTNPAVASWVLTIHQVFFDALDPTSLYAGKIYCPISEKLSNFHEFFPVVKMDSKTRSFFPWSPCCYQWLSIAFFRIYWAPSHQTPLWATAVLYTPASFTSSLTYLMLHWANCAPHYSLKGFLFSFGIIPGIAKGGTEPHRFRSWQIYEVQF